MSFSAAWRMLVRRWYLLIPAILVAACGAALGVTQTAPSYESQAQILLLPTASSSGDSGPSNPFLNLSASLGQTSQVIAVNVMSAQSALELQASGARAAYSVVPDTSLNAPVVRITATGPDKAAVTTTRDLVVARFKAALVTLQTEAGAPTSTLISTRVVTESSEPAKLLKQPIRNGIIGGILGLLVGLIPIPLSERRRISSLRSKSASADAGAAEPAERQEDTESDLSDDPRAVTDSGVVQPENVDPRVAEREIVNGTSSRRPVTPKVRDAELKKSAREREGGYDETMEILDNTRAPSVLRS